MAAFPLHVVDQPFSHLTSQLHVCTVSEGSGLRSCRLPSEGDYMVHKLFFTFFDNRTASTKERSVPFEDSFQHFHPRSVEYTPPIWVHTRFLTNTVYTAKLPAFHGHFDQKRTQRRGIWAFVPSNICFVRNCVSTPPIFTIS